MSDRLAVVIPVYNHAKFIGEGLESVLNQTHPPDRILCIDDGSKDDSLAVIESFKSRGVEAWGRENRGAHNTINELIQLAAQDCQWISILNSDDRYLPQRFERCFASAAANPEKSVIATRLEVIDAEGIRMDAAEPRARWFYGIQSMADLEDPPGPAEWLGRGNFVATTSNVFARADYLVANPFRPYRFNHDYFFLAGAAWRDQIAFCNEVHMQYRVHGSNTITTHPEPLIREMLRMHLDLFHHFASELKSNETMRATFYRYTRALWENMSSLHAGMFNVMLSQLAAEVSEDELEILAASITGPEFDLPPNRTLAGAYDGTTALSVGTLSQKLDQLRVDHERVQTERAVLADLGRLRTSLLENRWVNLGLALGLASGLKKNDGKTPAEKLSRLREQCTRSRWLRLGAALGLKVPQS